MALVYIAHPLGAHDADEAARNFQHYLKVCADATRNNLTVLSWAHHYLMHRDGLADGMTFARFLQADMALLNAAKWVLVAERPGGSPAHHSVGVCVEVWQAMRWNHRVVYGLGDTAGVAVLGNFDFNARRPGESPPWLFPNDPGGDLIAWAAEQYARRNPWQREG